MAKGAVCKTVSCGFNSHPRLHFLPRSRIYFPITLYYGLTPFRGGRRPTDGNFAITRPPSCKRCLKPNPRPPFFSRLTDLTDDGANPDITARKALNQGYWDLHLRFFKHTAFPFTSCPSCRSGRSGPLTAAALSDSREDR